ncbi:hypothetical protein QV08_10445 [Gallibacterium salpingitidis]|uniref:DUF4194 domain-containing protein n=1 Tax=Gallibacterium salpingitidis TaxID=505341 RepID=A0AB36DZU1_9PAST|nr:DUF4194 domain-containing protein [Gallibacterium salpingitidis]OBX06395.1 hypothetical protein QV08_10445 [Gallibacterium salpingitidis]OBX07195.1 hypothetical protein QV09_11405 [Gallibacterium salpingitidis]WKS98927.1 DUF4194 domain-containing protein [Gallibacterium salpingitidis]
MQLEENSELTLVVTSLFKGVIYRENNEKLWSDLLALHNTVKDYISVLNLTLYLDEAEGYAFLQSKSDEGEKSYPKLIARRALTFEVSLLLVLLRKSLVEFDANNNDVRFVLSRTQLIDLMKHYLGESSNQAKLEDKIESYINKVVELGFLQKLKANDNEQNFEVKRILKAFIDVEWLQQFNQWLNTCLDKKGSSDE